MQYRFGLHPLDLPYPSLAFSAIDALDQMDLANKNIFEYGSGASTLYWLKKGASVVSIEHSTEWFTALNSRLKSHNSLDYRLIAPDLANSATIETSFEDPQNYLSSSKEFKNSLFNTYVRQIDSFPDCYFDIILIDGRARPSCIMHSIKKVKVGGHVILDDAYRPHYSTAIKFFLDSFELKSFQSVCPRYFYEDTTYFFKRVV